MDCILQEEIIRLVNLGIYTVGSCFIVPELRGATIISVTVTPGGFEFHSDRGNVTVRRNVELTEEGYIYVEGRSQVTHTDLILWHDDSDGSIREVNKTRARFGRELLMLPSERSARAKVISKAKAEEKSASSTPRSQRLLRARRLKKSAQPVFMELLSTLQMVPSAVWVTANSLTKKICLTSR